MWFVPKLFHPLLVFKQWPIKGFYVVICCRRRVGYPCHPSCHATRRTLNETASRLVQAFACLVSKYPTLLRPGIVGTGGSMVVRLRVCMKMSTPLHLFYIDRVGVGRQRHCRTCRSLRELNNRGTVLCFWRSATAGDRVR